MASLWGLAEVLLAKLPFFWIGVGGSLLPGDLWLAGIARWFGAGGVATLQLLMGFWIWRTAIAFRRGIGWLNHALIGFLLVLLVLE